MAPPTYAAVSVGHLAPFPSPRALQWSTEGQLLVLTRSAVYILTPNLGLPFDEEATMGSRPPGSLAKSTEPVVKWFKTAVELENSMAHYWWDESSNFSTLSLGSLSLCWQEVAWSPSNLSGNGGCLLVAMNSNHEVSLWAPDKNHLKGEWVKTQDVTSLIREVALLEVPDENKGSSAGARRVLYSQANCIAWSRQMDVGPPGRVMDASLLAIGNRVGSVIFLRSNGNSGLEYVKTVAVSDHWITQLAWSEWIEDGTGRCIGTLAFASADGRFSVISISCALEGNSDPGNFSPTFDFEHNGLLDVKDLDRRGITSMQWIFPSDGSQVLVYNKPGTVHLWWYTDSENEPRNATLRLQSPPLSSSASSLAPACGYNYYKDEDVLIVTLADGSFHTVHTVCSAPTLKYQSDGGDKLTTDALSRFARQVFVALEGGTSQINRLDVMRTSCATSYGDYGTIVWLHEAARPEEFRYKTDAQQRSSIVMQQMWEHVDPQVTLLENIKDVLRDAEHGIRHSSTYALRGVLPRLRDSTIVSPLCSRLIELLAPQDSEIALDFAALSEASRAPLDRSRFHFRQALATHLFRSKALVRSRLKLLIAQICSRTTESVDPNAARSFNELGATYELSIVQDTLCVVLACLNTFSDHISGSEADRVFAVRLTSLALLISSPRPQLIELTRTLVTKLSLPLLEIQKVGDPLVPAGALMGCANMGERCPACQAGIKITQLTSAVCENGHIWERCSATFVVMDTPSVRTCIGCCRKTLLPPSQSGGDDVLEAWSAQELLEAVLGCLYCGSRYVRLL